MGAFMSVVEVKPEGWPRSVRVFYTTRSGGVSSVPYAGLNLAMHVGDQPESVRQNREALRLALPAGCGISWLDQVHGVEVVAARAGDEPPPAADGQITEEVNLACAVLTADCLPVLLTDRLGSQVAAIHAGWRGLQQGILERAVEQFAAPPSELRAWFGPAIGAQAYEVGPEVRAAFLDQGCRDGKSLARDCFAPSPSRSGHYLADLGGLAQGRLHTLGIDDVQGLQSCTYRDTERFFSYRRSGQTGRMATLIIRASQE